LHKHSTVKSLSTIAKLTCKILYTVISSDLEHEAV